MVWMRSGVALVWLAATACLSRPSSPLGGDAAGADASGMHCEDNPFGMPIQVASFAHAVSEPVERFDRAELWMAVQEADGNHVHVAIRAPNNQYAVDQLMPSVMGIAHQPSVRGDGLELFYLQGTGNLVTLQDLRRSTLTDPWLAESSIPLGGGLQSISVTPDGNTVYFVDASSNVRAAHRPTPDAPFALMSSALLTTVDQIAIGPDELELFAISPGGMDIDQYIRSDTGTGTKFVMYRPAVVKGVQSRPSMSPDGRRLYVATPTNPAVVLAYQRSCP
jgi:hypothetical protein